eukprot:c29089_g1_i1 orf=693-3179(+)
MFYSQFILSKSGPLGTIWIAAHLERRLRKNQVTDTNIGASVDLILFPEVPIALRLSGHLLLGVVRIYSRKVNYLFHDCSEAMVKIKRAFQKSSVNLPPEAARAPFHSVTLQETFDFDELETHLNREHAVQGMKRDEMDHHVTSLDLITLQDHKDDRGCFGSFFTLDERFPVGNDPYSVLDFNDEDIINHNSCIGEQNKVSPAREGRFAETKLEDVLPQLPTEGEIGLDKQGEVAASINGIGKMYVGESHEDPATLHDYHADVDGRLDPLADEQMLLEDPKRFVNQICLVSETGGPLGLPATALTQKLDPSETPVAALEIDQEEMMLDKQREVPDVEKLRSTMASLEEEEAVLFGSEKVLDIGNETPLERDATHPECAPEVMQEADEIDGRRNQIAEDIPLLNQETPITTGPPLYMTQSPVDFARDNDLVTEISTGQQTVSLKAMSSPFQSKSKRLKRKRQIFGKEVILSSFFMRRQLANVDDIRRVRRKVPCTEYELWRLERDSHIEENFSRPSVPGLCADLEGIYSRVFISKTGLPSVEHLKETQSCHEALASQIGSAEKVLTSDDFLAEDVNEIPCCEDDAQHEEGIYSPVKSPQEDEKLHGLSCEQGHELVDGELENAAQWEEEIRQGEKRLREEDGEGTKQIEYETEMRQINLSRGKAVVEDVMQEKSNVTGPEADCATTSTLPDVLDADTNGVMHEGNESKDLGFLTDSKDDDEDEMLKEAELRPSTSKLRPGDGRWSVRARALAQYLKTAFETLDSSPKLHADLPAKLSLNRLLEARTRKEAARMFFETLVLKTKDCIEVQQDSGFGDIVLFSTPHLMKGNF